MQSERKWQLNSLSSTLVYVGGLAIALVCTFLTEFMPDGDIKVWLGYLSTQVGFMFAIAVFFRFKPSELAAELPVKRKISPLALLLILPITAGVFLQNTILATGFVKLMSLLGVTASVNLPEPTNAVNVIMGLLCVCIAPAIGEEFMFRGVLLSSYRSKGGALAVILSAAVFALGHFNLAQLVHQFILGVILAYIVIATDNLWYAIGVHLINNVAALFLSLIPEYNALAAFDGKSALIMAIMFIVGVAILYPSIYALTRVAGRSELNKRDGWLFPIFFRKSSVGSDDIWSRPVSESGTRPDVCIIVFLCVLTLMSLLMATLSAKGA